MAVTKEVPGIEMPSYNLVVAYWMLSPATWIALAISWLVVLFSFVFSFEIPASGAVLVGGALVSEILFQQLGWRKLPCPPEGTFYLVPDSNTKKPVAQNPYCIAPVGSGRLGALLSLAHNDSISVNRRNEVTWFYRDVVDKAEKKMFFCIVLTAIIGTLLWGYGHKVFE